MFGRVFSGIIAICVAVVGVCMLLVAAPALTLAQTSPSNSQLLAVPLDTAKLTWDRSPDVAEVTHYTVWCANQASDSAPLSKSVMQTPAGIPPILLLKDVLTPGQWTCTVTATNRIATSPQSEPTSPFYTGYAAPMVRNLVIVVQ